MVTLEQVTALTFHLRLQVPQHYHDLFGHMNVQYYLGTFSDSVFNLAAQLGMTPAYFEREGYGFFAAENRLRYLREVQIGDVIACYSRLIARSDKRLHFMQFLVNETRQEVATIFEALAVHISTETRRSIAMPEPIIHAIDARLAVDNALDWVAPTSAAIVV